MKYIQFTNKGTIHTIILDKADFYKYRDKTITFDTKGNPSLYVDRLVKPIHRLIAQPPENHYVYHKDGDRLNLQRDNLLIEPAGLRNSQPTKPDSPGHSKYRNVSRRVRSDGKPANSWYTYVAGVKSSGFRTEEDAARWADRMSKRYYGEHAKLNFPEEV